MGLLSPGELTLPACEAPPAVEASAASTLRVTLPPAVTLAEVCAVWAEAVCRTVWPHAHKKRDNGIKEDKLLPTRHGGISLGREHSVCCRFTLPLLLPVSHLEPVFPDGHRHLPLTGSHGLSPAQSHDCVQFSPNLPCSHTGRGIHLG